MYKEHGLPVVVVRPFNSYGPNVTQPYIVPEIIGQLANSNTVFLRNVKSLRDLTYVYDQIDRLRFEGALGNRQARRSA
jgi:dTDP-glucose 4,6-dehydratase